MFLFSFSTLQSVQFFFETKGFISYSLKPWHVECIRKYIDIYGSKSRSSSPLAVLALYNSYVGMHTRIQRLARTSIGWIKKDAALPRSKLQFNLRVNYLFSILCPYFVRLLFPVKRKERSLVVRNLFLVWGCAEIFAFLFEEFHAWWAGQKCEQLK